MENTNDRIGLDGPKERILMAASEVFAEQGFAHGTTREIAKRAGANIAAISYHFGSKEQLYLFVLNYWKRKAFEKIPIDRMRDESIPPEERLRLFVRSMLETTLDEETALWFSKMIARELVLEPTSAVSSFLDDDVKVVSQCLLGILQELCGEDANPEAVNFCAAGVVGQCTFLTANRAVLQTIFRVRQLNWDNIDAFVDHIVRFTTGAISAIKAGIC